MLKHSANHGFEVGLEKFSQPGGGSSFYQGHVQTAAQAANKLQNRFGFGFEDSFHHPLAGILNGRRERCWMNIQPNRWPRS
jgi:hypothetical protein